MQILVVTSHNFAMTGYIENVDHKQSYISGLWNPRANYDSSHFSEKKKKEKKKTHQHTSVIWRSHTIKYEYIFDWVGMGWKVGMERKTYLVYHYPIQKQFVIELFIMSSRLMGNWCSRSLNVYRQSWACLCLQICLFNLF